MTLIIKIVTVVCLFLATIITEHSLFPTIESEVALSQLDSTEASATMRSYSHWKNLSSLMYIVPVGLGLLIFKSEIKKGWKLVNEA